MARPERNDIDYFPHVVTHGKKMFIIENKYKNDGYAVWFKILEEIGKANYHYLDFNDIEQTMYLSSKFNIDEELLLNIIEDLAKLNAINKDLYLDHKIVFSEKFIESIQDAYKRRNNNCITLDGLCKHLHIKCKHNDNINLLKCNDKPQSKVKDTKLNNNKVNESEENPITKFTYWFNLRRKHYLEIESNFKRLSFQDKNNLEELKELYKKEDFEKVMINMVNDKYCNEANRIIPSHFLEYFDNYISQEQKPLITKKQKIQRGWKS